MGEVDLSQISTGVAYIQQGYIDYAREVIAERALPSKYDGLKPVNRRILYTAYKDKVRRHMKSERFYGTVLNLHPHGGSSVYQAMVPMTQVNGGWAVPVLNGVGNWGGVYKTDPPAAPRYTEVCLHSNADLYFGEMNGVDFSPNYDSTDTEPDLLPVCFPGVLVNSTSGIAVGFGSNIPSFNLLDVCDLVIDCVNNGSCGRVISPDFVTGGQYVQNNQELLKLMRAGKGKLKLRGKTIIDGKKIICTEVPYGKTIQGLLRQINALEDSNIRTAYDSDDSTRTMCFTVECVSKAKVDEVLFRILKDTDLQYVYSANITVVDNGLPVTQGVWGIIEDWVAWRKSVLVREYGIRIDGLRQSAREAIAFMNVVNSYERRMELVRLIADKGKRAGVAYVTDNFTRDEVPEDLIDFVSSRSLPSYNDGGKYADMAARCNAEIDSLQRSIDNVGDVIKAEMKKLKTQFKEANRRRTEVVTKDYTFVEEDKPKERAVDRSTCMFEITNGFIKKIGYRSSSEGCDFLVDGMASDRLILFDNYGRILRVYGEDLQYSVSDLGTYLPRYLGFEPEDDWRVTYAGKLDGRELMLLYKDGYVGTVNTAEWVDSTRSVRVLSKGINAESADSLGVVVPWDEVPEVYAAMDTDGRIGWFRTAEIMHKGRTARTRVMFLKGAQLWGYMFSDLLSFLTLLNNNERHYGKMAYLSQEGDFHGSTDMFTRF